MSSENHDELASAFGLEVAEEMLKFGITCVSMDHFHYKDFRYTNVKDAIAQANRQQAINGQRRDDAPKGIKALCRF
jgi:hypothetical protein